MKKYLYIIFAFLSMLVSCTYNDTLHPYKWKKIGEPFDSLTCRLENQFNDYAFFYDIDSTIGRMATALNKDTIHSKVKKERILYWKGRLWNRMGENDSSTKILNQALLLNDSDKYYYDRLRIITVLVNAQDSVDGGFKFRHFSNCIKYCKKLGDEGFEAMTFINMGNLLSEIDENEIALSYLDRADSINIAIGYPKLAFKNQINRARTMESLGQYEEADSILTNMIGHPYLERDSFNSNLIYRNLYAHPKPSNKSNREKYLYIAYNQVKDNYRFRNIWGIYKSLLSELHRVNGNLDSAIYYADASMADFEHTDEYKFRAIILLNKSLACMMQNKTDSALMYRLEYESHYNYVESKRAAAEVLRLNAVKELEQTKSDYAKAIYKRDIIILVIAFAIIALSGITYFLNHRRNMRNKLKSLSMEMQLSRAKQKMVATSAIIEEKDNMLSVLKDELITLRQEGKISDGSSKRLESSIKTHLSQNESGQSFIEMFDSIHPDFSRKMHDLCPGIPENQVRLACYILMGYDNNKIARLLIIKPESVRQSKWRLAKRLGIPENCSLEQYLSKINDE